MPVVGFEIESSWRTRKHVKGDLLNLQDAGVSLGVIVLAGDSPKDEGLRTFAAQLVDRPGPNILVWTAQDVRSLAAPQAEPIVAATSRPAEHREGDVWRPPVEQNEASPGAVLRQDSVLASVSHAGKYAPLHRWLSSQREDPLHVTFAEVEQVLGFPLPPSCRQHGAHWHSYEGSAVARAIVDAGWTASHVSLQNQTLTFTRSRG